MDNEQEKESTGKGRKAARQLYANRKKNFSKKIIVPRFNVTIFSVIRKNSSFTYKDSQFRKKGRKLKSNYIYKLDPPLMENSPRDNSEF